MIDAVGQRLADAVAGRAARRGPPRRSGARPIIASATTAASSGAAAPQRRGRRRATGRPEARTAPPSRGPRRCPTRARPRAGRTPTAPNRTMSWMQTIGVAHATSRTTPSDPAPRVPTSDTTSDHDGEQRRTIRTQRAGQVRRSWGGPSAGSRTSETRVAEVGAAQGQDHGEHGEGDCEAAERVGGERTRDEDDGEDVRRARHRLVDEDDRACEPSGAGLHRWSRPGRPGPRVAASVTARGRPDARSAAARDAVVGAAGVAACDGPVARGRRLDCSRRDATTSPRPRPASRPSARLSLRSGEDGWLRDWRRTRDGRGHRWACRSGARSRGGRSSSPSAGRGGVGEWPRRVGVRVLAR